LYVDVHNNLQIGVDFLVLFSQFHWDFVCKVRHLTNVITLYACISCWPPS